MDRLPSRETGKYREKNFEILKQLENHFVKSYIFLMYVGKLLSQLCTVIVSMTISEAYFQNEYFSFTFECSVSIDQPPQGRISPIIVSCVYSSFRLFVLLKNLNIFLLSIALISLICGIVWCFIRHSEELGSKDVALFAFSSGLRPSDYPEEYIHNPFNPRIRNDLDFLVLKLFRADSSHGFVFKDIQVTLKYSSIICCIILANVLKVQSELKEIIEKERCTVQFNEEETPTPYMVTI